MSTKRIVFTFTTNKFINYNVYCVSLWMTSHLLLILLCNSHSLLTTDVNNTWTDFTNRTVSIEIRKLQYLVNIL